MWGVLTLASYSLSIVTGTQTIMSAASLGTYQSSYLSIVTRLMSVLGSRDDTVNMIYCAPDKELPHTASTP